MSRTDLVAKFVEFVLDARCFFCSDCNESISTVGPSISCLLVRILLLVFLFSCSKLMLEYFFMHLQPSSGTKQSDNKRLNKLEPLKRFQVLASRVAVGREMYRIIAEGAFLFPFSEFTAS